jgi:hypothetical protein
MSAHIFGGERFRRAAGLGSLPPAAPPMSAMGHSLRIVARRKSLYVRCSPKATQSQPYGLCGDPVELQLWVRIF